MWTLAYNALCALLVEQGLGSWKIDQGHGLAQGSVLSTMRVQSARVSAAAAAAAGMVEVTLHVVWTTRATPPMLLLVLQLLCSRMAAVVHQGLYMPIGSFFSMSRHYD